MIETRSKHEPKSVTIRKFQAFGGAVCRIAVWFLIGTELWRVVLMEMVGRPELLGWARCWLGRCWGSEISVCCFQIMEEVTKAILNSIVWDFWGFSMLWIFWRLNQNHYGFSELIFLSILKFPEGAHPHTISSIDNYKDGGRHVFCSTCNVGEIWCNLMQNSKCKWPQVSGLYSKGTSIVNHHVL